MSKSVQAPVSKVRESLELAGRLRWFHWGVVALSFCLTLFAWYFAKSQLNARVALQFDREADQVVELVIERMTKYEDALLAGVAFVGANDGEWDRQSWNRYATSIQVEQKYPGINGIGIITCLNREQVSSFLERQRIDLPEFTIHPHRVADEYWPIISIIPLKGNEEALGLDMAHEANRIAAARKARDTGLAQITGPIVLVQDSLKTPGFLFFAPFYRSVASSSDQDLQKRFAGIVYAPFVFRKLMEGALQKKKRQVGIRITDASQVLFDEHVESEADFDPNPLMKKEVSFPLYGRTWTFDVWSAKSFRENVDTTQPSTILIAGLTIDGMLIGLFLMLSCASRKALGFADTMTADLEKLELAARVNQIGIWDFDPVTGALDWDDAMFEMYGHRREDFSGAYEAWISCVHPDDRSTSEAMLNKALAEARSLEFDFRMLRPDGIVRHINAKAVVFRDAAGNPIRVLGANTDVTNQKIAAHELETTRRLQAAIQDAAGVAIIATDPDGVIVTFNATAEEMLGYSKDEMLLKQTPAILHDTEEIAQRAKQLSKELQREVAPGFDVFVLKAASGGLEQREWTYIRKDGSTLPVLLTVTALRDQDNNLSGYLGVAADISERKLALQKIENANASLARSNEDLAQFAYVASHDLQEPLRKVSSFCELLQEDCGEQLSPIGEQYVGYIIDGAQRMRAPIQDLLSYSRIDSESRKTIEVDTNELVRLAIDNLSEAIRDAGAVVTYDPLPRVEADPRQIMQLFQNLIGNAIKYRGTEAPRVHISSQVRGSHWRFSIEDNGIGIAPGHREQIFGIFKRLHNQNEYLGTGIGLAICKRIVDRLGGRIWVESSSSGGSIFRFEFARSTPGSLAPAASAFGVNSVPLSVGLSSSPIQT